MSTTTVHQPRARSRRATPPPRPSRREVPWAASLASGLAVLLAAGPLTAVVQGTGWLGYSALVVGAVVGVGLLLHRLGRIAVVIGQCGAVLLVLTLCFSRVALLGVLPGPATMSEFGALMGEAGRQIDAGFAPIPATPEILFLVTAAFGLLAIIVHVAAVAANAPAAAGVPLLAVFAVPAALAEDLLPWWAMAGPAAGFGVLLAARTELRRQLPGGAALVALGLVLALLVGTVTTFVGTAGRFAGNAGASATDGAIGLSPFTALRGQLTRTEPVDLFEVEGLPQPSYLRVLTLRQYVPDSGWQATRPAPGVVLPGLVQPQPLIPGDVVDVELSNLGYRDYWLPLYGEPLEVSGFDPENWHYDVASGVGYSGRPRQEDGWQQRTLIPRPTAQQLRAAEGINGIGLEYLDTTGVDQRVTDIAQEVVAGRTTGFDRALALLDYFTGPGTAFSYSLQTAPGAGDDALVEFLTVGRRGYCEQFASAMAVMLRTVGVPARVAIGFTAGTGSGASRTITTADAHAWVEAWFPGIGWTSFDPTPLTDGRTIVPPYVEEARAEQAVDLAPLDEAQVPDEVPLGAGPTPAPGASEQPPSETTPPTATEDGGLPLWPFAVVLLALGVALVPATLRMLDRRRRMNAVAAGGPGAAAAGWAELLAQSRDRGTDDSPSDTVRAAARLLVRRHRLDSEAQQALRSVVGAVEASYYGGVHPGPGELDAPTRTVAAGIARGTRLSLRGRLLPRSVLRRRRDHPTHPERGVLEVSPAGADRESR